MKYTLSTILFITTLTLFQMRLCAIETPSSEEDRKWQMINDLKVIKHHYEVSYAPLAWKKSYWNWDIDIAYKEAKKKILSTPSITSKQFHQILRTFVNSMKDYHVDISFYSTETSSLPFGVKGVNGRYFVSWIDHLRLPTSHFRISVGDELLSFDGEPIAAIIERIKNEGGKFANPDTDNALAEVRLTRRKGSSGDIVPKGALLATFQSAKNQKKSTYQLRWSHQPEHIYNRSDVSPSIDLLDAFFPKQQNLSQPMDFIHAKVGEIQMMNPLLKSEMGSTDRGLGARKSFVPVLGEIVWNFNENPDFSEELYEGGGIIDWVAYIYQHANGKQIGYIRIPHFTGDEIDSAVFGKIVTYMDKRTDGLVIDQLHNFGGYVDFQYQLSSILVTDTPFRAPYHQIKITQKEVLDAYESLKILNLLEASSNAREWNHQRKGQFSEEDENQSSKEEEYSGELINHQWLLHVKAYFEFILEEWSAGRTLTNPTPILGVDRINGHPKYRYTKPILVLINEMDFSGADFFPAILKDNERATLFGNRTAGAGGYVYSFQFPNSHGIASCTYTASIAERANEKKIENIGVLPDIPYTLSVEDVQNNYQEYVNAVNQAVDSLYVIPKDVDAKPISLPDNQIE